MKQSPTTAPPNDGEISNTQLALSSGAVFDVPPRTRRLILVAGAAGIVVVVTASLIGGHDHTIELDKILHFSGYAILASLFVFALRPAIYVPALLVLVGMGFLIEYLQSFTGRSMEFMDGVANTVGVAAGASLALLIRGVFSYVRRELAMGSVRRNLVRFSPGEFVLREGGRVRSLYVIKAGQFRLTKRVGDEDVGLGYAEAGDVLGTIGLLLGAPQFATIQAVSPAILYRMEFAELMESVGGSEQPVCTVLQSLAEALRFAGERVLHNEAQLAELALAVEAHGNKTSDS